MSQAPRIYYSLAPVAPSRELPHAVLAAMHTQRLAERMAAAPPGC